MGYNFSDNYFPPAYEEAGCSIVFENGKLHMGNIARASKRSNEARLRTLR